jgi:hypothetical protein
LQKREQKIVLL